MASILGLRWLYETVKAQLANDGVPVSNEFGWRIPAQHPIGNRIAWIPGDPTGSIGPTGPARNPGGYPRSLGTLRELFTVVINGQDLTDPENEMAQYDVTRRLRDAWYRAVYRAKHGAFAVRQEAWLTTRKERRHGAALRVVTEIEATIPDMPWDDVPEWSLAPADTTVVVAVTLLDNTEFITAQIAEAVPVTFEGIPVTHLGEPVTILTPIEP